MQELRESQLLREAEAQEASRAAGQRYGIVAGVFSDADLAQELLLELVDAGYEGLLYSSDVEGSTLFEVRVGPFEDLRSARRNADTLERAYELRPQIVVERSEEAPEELGSEAPEEPAPNESN